MSHATRKNEAIRTAAIDLANVILGSSKSYEEPPKEHANSGSETATVIGSGALNKLGDFLREISILDEADQLYSAALDINPRDRNALRGKLDVATRSNNPRSILKTAQALVAAFPQDRFSWHQLAWKAVDQNDPLTALQVLELLENNGTDDIELQRTIATSLKDSGENEKAKDLFRVIVASTPNDRLLQIDFLNLLQKTGDVQGALEQSDISLKRFPEDLRFVAMRARALIRAQRPKNAVDLLDTVLNAQTSDPSHCIMWATAINATGDSDRAKRVMLDVVNRGANTTHGWLLLCEISKKEGDLDKAIGFLEQALADMPNDLELLRRKGHILFQAGRFPEAKVLYERLLEHDPKDVNALRFYSRTLAASGDHSKAADVFSEFAKHDGTDIEVLEERVRQLVNQGELVTAVEMLEQRLLGAT